MNLRFLFASCLSFVFFAGSVFAESDDLPEGKPISSVTIEVRSEKEGVHTEQQALQKSLKTQPLQPFSSGDMDEDLKFLSKEYEEVEPKVGVEGGRVSVCFIVSKKPLIHAIEFRGNKAFKEDALKKKLEIKAGDVFSRGAFQTAVQKVRTYYMKKGYFEADVQYDVKKTSTGEVDITIKIQEGQAGFVDSILIQGVNEKEEDKIVEQLMTKPYAWWHSWLTDQGTFYQDVFRQDELTILTLLHEEGYLDAQVQSKILPVQNKDKITIDITVKKGEIYSLGTIQFVGNTVFTADEMLTKLKWKEKDPFSQETLREKTKQLYLLYGSKGYVDVSINPESTLREKERVYDVRFVIDEKSQFRVGLIHVSGNTRTDASVILHESLLVPGEILNTSYLAKTEERLRNTGYFKNVNVYTLKSTELASGSRVPFRDIHIEVEEQSTTASFSAFAGFSTTEKVTGGFGLSETNFKMKGFSRLFSEGFSALRGGGENISLTYTIGTKMSRTQLSWVKPYIFDTPWVFSTDLQQEKNKYAFSEYEIKSKSANFTGRYPLNPFLKYDLFYRIKDSHIVMNPHRHDPGKRELIRESKNDGTISAVGTGLEYDSTNHPFRPTEGTRSSLTLEYAGLCGDHHFSTLSYLNTLFYSPWEKGLIQLKGNAQFIKTLFGTRPRTLPLDERLYLGGETTMRGFQFNAVGPHFHDKDRTPRGGVSSVFLSGEYDHQLMKKLDGFVFIDIGNVSFKEFYMDTLRSSVGYGIKFYITDNAPLIVGVGYPLNPASKRDVRHFFLSIGATF